MGSVLLCGSETRMLKESLKKQIDGCYTRMQRMALDINRKEHLANREVYGKLPLTIMEIPQSRMQLARRIGQQSTP